MRSGVIVISIAIVSLAFIAGMMPMAIGIILAQRDLHGTSSSVPGSIPGGAVDTGSPGGRQAMAEASVTTKAQGLENPGHRGPGLTGHLSCPPVRSVPAPELGSTGGELSCPSFSEVPPPGSCSIVDGGPSRCRRGGT